MDFFEYQVATDKTAMYQDSINEMFLNEGYGAQINWLVAMSYVVNGLTGEAGEVAQLLKKYIRDGGSPEVFSAMLTSELGDVLWYVAQVARLANLSLSHIAERNIEKLSSRKERGMIGGSGSDR